MRGQQERTGALFSYISTETNSAVPPTPAGEAVGRSGPRSTEPDLLQDLSRGRQALNSARVDAAGSVAAGDLLHPFGADADLAARLQPAVPLVYRPQP